ncbi:MAG: ATP-grasp domain-containing protein [Negativicutes bacterium]|nr:ATP-grasp domain-containing protein [Negativicutes bacterium]
MRLLIYELFSTGGMAGGEGLSVLGFSMLDAVLTDFAAVGGLELFTVLDRRLEASVALGAYAKKVNIRWGSGAGMWREDFTAALRLCDGALVIAPETDGVLTKLTTEIESSGKLVIGSTAAATALAGNKALALQRLQDAGLPVPKTEIFNEPVPQDWVSVIARRFVLPVVVKPVDGTGCRGITVAEDAVALESARRWVNETSRQPLFMVQEYISGEPASVSCLVAAGNVLPLVVNRQRIDGGGRFCFKGMTVPYRHPQSKAAASVAKRACEAIEGLGGYVGVDLVFGPEGPVIMEINPRITVAYITLREVVKENLAESICQVCLERRLPAAPRITGSYTYLID